MHPKARSKEQKGKEERERTQRGKTRRNLLYLI